MSQYLLIYRAEAFSPNNIEKDASILKAVGDLLESNGHKVTYATEDTCLEELRVADKTELKVLSMARKARTLMALMRSGFEVVNVPQSVMMVAQSRSTTLEMLYAAGVAVPPYWEYEPSEDKMVQCEPELQQLLPGWMKCMHPMGVNANDVRYVQTPLEADIAVMEMAAQGSTDIVLTRHLKGPVVKVYCVGRWMRWFWPQIEGYSKFGYEVHNDEVEACRILDEIHLQRLSEQIARILGLSIFGYDAIVDASGKLTVIDVNDWPSFSRFRSEAAQQIVELIENNSGTTPKTIE